MRIHYEVGVEIDRPIEDVYEYVTSPENDDEWIPSVIDADPPAAEMAVGTTWRRTIDVLDGTDTTVVCIEHDPPSRFAYRTIDGIADGRLKNAAVTTLDETASGTHLSYQATVEVTGFLKLFRPILDRMAHSETESSLQNLQAELDSPAGTHQPAP